jgi:hypothetical protein
MAHTWPLWIKDSISHNTIIIPSVPFAGYWTFRKMLSHQNFDMSEMHPKEHIFSVPFHGQLADEK